MPRKILALLLVALPVLAVGAALLLVSDLPDPLPTHWNVRGEVDRTMSHGAYAAMALLVTGLAAVLAAGVARGEVSRTGRMGVTGCAFAAYLVGGLSVMTLVVADGAAAADDVRLHWWAVLAALGAGALGVGAVVAIWPAPVADTDGTTPSPDLPRLDLGDGERAVYVTVVRSRGFAALGIASGLIGVLLAVTVDLLVGATMLAVTAAALTLSQVTVRVDETGLRLGFGPGVRVRVKLADIRQAGAEEIRPLAWGGWGYRMMNGNRALVLRSGPGLVLDLHNGSRFAVTVDGPDEPAALINGLLTRSRPNPS